MSWMSECLIGTFAVGKSVKNGRIKIATPNRLDLVPSVHSLRSSSWQMVPGAGLEPARTDEGPQDFKSCASANSATRAGKQSKVQS